MGNNPSAEEQDAELSSAAEQGKVTRVESLLRKGADPNKRTVDPERKARTCLHRAAKTKNNVNVLTKLLDYIKDVDAVDEDGNTALHLAAGYYNNAAVVQTLLHAKPNCKIQNNFGETALHSAVKGGSDLKIVELLLMDDSDPNISNMEGNTALHLCAAGRGVDPMIPGMLLRFGANPNLKNDQGDTALHIASRSGNKAVLLLLKFHAKVRLKNKEGRKASEVAATEEIKNILEWEEKELEERTTHCESANVRDLSRTSSRALCSPGFGSNRPEFYYFNRSSGLYSSSVPFGVNDLNHQWKTSGGDGVIHLPDKSDIVVPPQAVPYGTNFEVKITPAQPRDSNEEDIPEFDFDMFNFVFDVKIELPGVLFVAPWMAQAKDDRPSSPFSVNPSYSPAFTSMCMEGRNRWKSSRELASQSDGILALQFKLSREKSQPLSYRGPLPSRISSTEIELKHSLRGFDGSDFPPVTPDAETEANCSRPEETASTTASSSDDEDHHESRSSNHSETAMSGSDSEIENVMGSHSEMHKETTRDSESLHSGAYVSESAATVSLPVGEDFHDLEHESHLEKQGEDIFVKPGNTSELWSAEENPEVDENDMNGARYDHHPIDPALATIQEESHSDVSEKKITSDLYGVENTDEQLKSNRVSEPTWPDVDQEEISLQLNDSDYEPRFSSGRSDARLNVLEGGYDITQDDIENFSSVTQQKQAPEGFVAEDKSFSTTEISDSFFM